MLVTEGVPDGVGAGVLDRVAVAVERPVTVLERDPLPEGVPVCVPVIVFVEDPVTVRDMVGGAEGDRDELNELLGVGVAAALAVPETVAVPESEEVTVPDPV